MIRIDRSFKDTQIDQALGLLLKFVNEDGFWPHLKNWVASVNLSQHDILEKDSDILGHIYYMFNCDLNVDIVPYKTKWPLSSVLGYAEGNRVYENTRKVNALELHERVGHLGHEIVHLFGYHHEYQGQKTSAAVAFGDAMEAYAEVRIRELTATTVE